MSRPSLIDIFNPPANPWLESIALSSVKLPVGVRIVRLSDDETGQSFNESRSQSAPTRKTPLGQAA